MTSAKTGPPQRSGASGAQVGGADRVGLVDHGVASVEACNDSEWGARRAQDAQRRRLRGIDVP
jgi:hypothetical protein